MVLTYKNRQVEIDGISGTIDEPMIENAYYLDGAEEELTIDELDELQYEYGDHLAQHLAEKQADDLHDWLKGD